MTAPLIRPPARHQELVYYVLSGHNVTAAGASCTLTADTNANMADGNLVTLNDGFKTVTYEYDKAADGVTSGNVAVTAGTTAATVAANFRTAILASQPALSVVDNANGTLTITNNWPGTGGNTTNSKTSASALAITNFSGGQSGTTGIVATTTSKVYTTKTRALRIARVVINVPAGFTQDASNFWTIALKDGSQTLWSYSTQTTTGQGTITANTPTEFVATANHSDLNPGDTLSLVFTKAASAATFPPFNLLIEGRLL